MSVLLESLNQVQKTACLHRDGPLVVFAGAGSGKTRIITTRIAWLIEQGVLPWEILAVTFTNKAAEEMKHRAEALTPEARRCLVTTFHSACARWLREFATELGFDSNFSIYDDADSSKALKNILKEMVPKGDLPTLVNEMKSFIHRAKTAGLFPNEAEQLAINTANPIPAGAVQVYRQYQEYLQHSNAMDFDDLLMNLLLLLRTNKKVRGILSQRYRYIMVDEFQDTNRTQFEIIQILSEQHRNLMVVGDDDQSIYSWRGATPSNIIDFHQTYQEAKRIALEQNYRCTGNIVNAASKLVAQNKRRAPKTLFTEADAGDLIEVHLESDGEMEAYWIADRIQAERRQFQYDDIAIFYRTNSQSRSLEEALRRNRIPYTIFGAVEFYERLEIKDMLAYLRLLLNDSDNMSFLRAINVPTRGIGDKAVDQIGQYARANNLTLMQASRMLATTPKVGPKLKYFVDLIAALRIDILQAPLKDAIKILLEALEYPDYLKKKYPDQYLDKIDNIQELAAALAEFQKKNPEARLDEWMQTVSLVRDDPENDQEIIGVSMMTLHMAKGLEFPRVYIAGLEDGLLPHKNSVDDHSMVEEERRLLYVGITRAKVKLSLTCVKRRRSYNTESMNPPSRFLQEIPKEYVKFSQKAEEAFNPQPVASAYSYDYEDSGDPILKGSRVFHPTYG
ncbi:MAG: UvrD-helicase domain-containing protein, partial [Pseudobdellovibrionaceae bacterium]|nr:UvrD-helicase domain-containing protein [Pseudobdellovibrionaceae bacterium]